MALRSSSLVASLFLVACAAAPPPPMSAPREPSPPPPVPASKAQPEVPMTPEKALERLFTAEKASAAWFDEGFLKAVPIDKIDQVTAQVRGQSGAFKGVRASGAGFVIDFEKGSWDATVKLDGAGRFTGLLIKPGQPESATVEEAVTAFRALPGKISVLLLTDDAVRGAATPDLPLGVGSTFKLAILAALRAEVDQKKRSWKDVVELSADHRSLPSGFLQTWPDHAPLTLYSLAALMISISDNTATDALLGLAGRGNVEALAPRNKPFLATREMFQLKAPDGAEALAAFQKGDEAARRRVLDGLAKKPLPEVESYPEAPTALDVEWFFSARELCALMKKVARSTLHEHQPRRREEGRLGRRGLQGRLRAGRAEHDHLAHQGRPLALRVRHLERAAEARPRRLRGRVCQGDRGAEEAALSGGLGRGSPPSGLAGGRQGAARARSTIASAWASACSRSKQRSSSAGERSRPRLGVRREQIAEAALAGERPHGAALHDLVGAPGAGCRAAPAPAAWPR